MKLVHFFKVLNDISGYIVQTAPLSWEKSLKFTWKVAFFVLPDEIFHAQGSKTYNISSPVVVKVMLRAVERSATPWQLHRSQVF